MTEVRRLVGVGDAPDCLDVRDLALLHVERLRAMRREMEALEQTLSSMAQRCDAACKTGQSLDCRIVEELVA